MIVLIAVGASLFFYSDSLFMTEALPMPAEQQPAMLKAKAQPPKKRPAPPTPKKTSLFQNAHQSKLPMNFEKRHETQAERLARLQASEKHTNLSGIVQVGSKRGANLTKANIDAKSREIFPQLTIKKIAKKN